MGKRQNESLKTRGEHSKNAENVIQALKGIRVEDAREALACWRKALHRPPVLRDEYRSKQ